MWASFSAGERGRTGEVSRTVEAGRGAEEKTPRPVGVCKFVVVVLLLWVGRSFWCVERFHFFFLVVGRSGNHGLREVTNLPFSGVYLIYK